MSKLSKRLLNKHIYYLYNNALASVINLYDFEKKKKKEKEKEKTCRFPLTKIIKERYRDS